MRPSDLSELLAAFKPDFIAGISEFELLKRLRDPPYSMFAKAELNDTLTMFRCHFIVFNALYLLRDRWIDEQVGELDIFTVKIQLMQTSNLSPADNALATSDPLRAYYLDWANFDNTNRNDVEGLLEEFWQRMGTAGALTDKAQHRKACNILNLDENVEFSRQTLKKRYLSLQHAHHPDKGGDMIKSQQLTWAYEQLKPWARQP